MRKILLSSLALSVCALILTPGAFAKRKKTQEKPKKHIVLLNISGTLEKETMERLQKYAGKELCVKTDIAVLEIDKNVTIEKCAKNIAKKNEYTSPIVISFHFTPADEEHICILTNQQVAVVNTARLKIADKEKYERRLERMLMRSAATLVGIGFDPDPHCVMHSYKNIEDLDRMGRNFSPPWQDKFKRAAVKIGMEMIPVKPPNLKKCGD